MKNPLKALFGPKRADVPGDAIHLPAQQTAVTTLEDDVIEGRFSFAPADEFPTHPKDVERASMYSYGCSCITIKRGNYSISDVLERCPVPFWTGQNGSSHSWAAREDDDRPDTHSINVCFVDPSQPAAVEHFTKLYPPMAGSAERLAEMKKVLGLEGASNLDTDKVTTLVMFMGMMMHHGFINRFEEAQNFLVNADLNIMPDMAAKWLDEAKEYWHQCELQGLPTGRNPDGDVQMEDPRAVKERVRTIFESPEMTAMKDEFWKNLERDHGIKRTQATTPSTGRN